MPDNEVFVKTENISEKNQAEKLRERLETQREKRRLTAKLQNVKKLADSDSEDEGAAEWYKRTKYSEKSKKNRNDDRSKKKINENDRNISKKQYTSKNLDGLSIGHKIDSFQEGHQLILTLKDKDVLGDEGDVLENISLVDKEKADKNVKNKSKRPEYRPYDDEEFEEYETNIKDKKPSLLSKYDEEIDGPIYETFRIGTTIERKKTNLAESSAAEACSEWADLKIASEYYTPEEMIKFKKPSKKCNLRSKMKKEIKSSSKLVESAIEEPKPKRSRRNEDSKNKIKTKVILDIDNNDIDEDDDYLMGPNEDLSNIVIDDEAQNELQSVLHKARKIKLKEKLIDPMANIAHIIKKNDSMDVDELNGEQKNDLGNLLEDRIVLNATAEFCRNLGEINLKKRLDQTTKMIDENEDDDEDEKKDVEMELDGDRDHHINHSDEEDVDDGKKFSNNWNEVDLKQEYDSDSNDRTEPRSSAKNQPILEEEPDVRVGVAGALKLAMTKGYLDKESNKSIGAARSASSITVKSYTIEEKF